MTDHADDLAALQANVDQGSAAAREVARAIAAYFLSLVEQGLTREEALELTKDWQALQWETETG